MDLLGDAFWSCGSPPESIPLVAVELPSGPMLGHSSPRVHFAAADTTVFADLSLFETDIVEFLPFDEMDNELRVLDEMSMKSSISTQNLEMPLAQNFKLTSSDKEMKRNELLNENCSAEVHKICAEQQVAGEFSLEAIDIGESMYGAEDIGPAKIHICEICSRIFKKIDEFKAHYQTCYLDMKTEENFNLICQKEETSINTMDDLSLQNTDVLLGEAIENVPVTEDICTTNMHKCSMCSRIFTRLEELNTHCQACFMNMISEKTLEGEEIFIDISEITTEDLSQKYTERNIITPSTTERITKAVNNRKSTPTETVQPEKEVNCPIPNNLFSELRQFINIPSQLSSTAKNFFKVNRPYKTVYQCSFCFEIYKQKHPLMCHMQRHKCMEPQNTSLCSPNTVMHSRSSKLRLPGQRSTPVNTKSTVSLPSHKSGKHPKDKVSTFLCSLCNRTFSKKTSLKDHQRVHSGEKPYMCHTCPFSCNQQSNLVRHVRTHFKNGFFDSFTCSVCGWIFDTNRELGIHCSVRHGKRKAKFTPQTSVNITHGANTSSNVQTVQANQMNNTLEDESTQIINVYQEITTPPSNLLELTKKSDGQSSLKPFYTCSVCSKNFRYKSLFNAHIRTHTKDRERPFICAFCHKTYMTAPVLKHHMQIHGKAMPHPCADCDEGFLSVSDLESHILKCHNELWLCQFCGEMFHARTQLAVHERSHKPHSCDICHFTCSLRHNMTRHIKRHQGSLKPFACLSCNRKFATEDDLKVHCTRKRGKKSKCCFKYFKTVCKR